MTSIAATEAPPLSATTNRQIAYWLIAVAALTLAMVVIGGITRLTESGLSITRWQPIEGVLPPLGQAAWQEAFHRYQQIPEYQQIHYGMTLAQFKGIFFWEYLHRLMGRLTGLVALALPLTLFAMRRVPAQRLGPLFLVPVLVLLQGLLGWYMVESGLEIRTSVSQYRLTAHLSLALVLYSYCIWQAATILSPAAEPMEAGLARRCRRVAGILVGLIALTILAGGFTAGTKAGYVYNTFPLMDGRLVPSGYFIETPWWINPFDNVTAIQFDHRVLAITTFLAVAGFFAWTRGRALPRRLRLPILLLAAMAVIQVALGISTLLLMVPIPLAACHQVGAVLLLTTALLTLHGARPGGVRA